MLRELRSYSGHKISVSLSDEESHHDFWIVIICAPVGGFHQNNIKQKYEMSLARKS
jgi:hypothetical protein